MTPTLQSPLTNDQTTVWIRGLLSIAWADGHLDREEQQLISNLTHQDLAESDISTSLEPISPDELAAAIGHDPKLAENFLRMAVMVALADGAYSFCEDEVLYQFSLALGLDTNILKVLRSTLTQPEELVAAVESPLNSGIGSALNAPPDLDDHLDVLSPVREWLDKMEIHDPKVAHLLCRLIPPQCPFERDISVFGHKVAHIPPLCKLNPLYEQLIGLRFRALCFLADQCGEDISSYC
jgi:tellurite resistance protein